MEPCPAMEGLLPAAGSAFQLIPEHQWGDLLVVSESLRHISGPCAFPWEILACTMPILTEKRRHTLTGVKALGKGILPTVTSVGNVVRILDQ